MCFLDPEELPMLDPSPLHDYTSNIMQKSPNPDV